MKNWWRNNKSGARCVAWCGAHQARIVMARRAACAAWRGAAAYGIINVS